MDIAKTEAARSKKGDAPFVIIADEQTSGRGRIPGRSWKGERGASLFMTLAFESETSSSQALPLRIGQGVREALGKYTDVSLYLKWPNDIVVPSAISSRGYRKICGIICEASSGWILAGVGVNVKKGSYPVEFSDSAVCMEELHSGAYGTPDLPSLARHISESIFKSLAKSGWKTDYSRAMWGRGHPVEFIAGHPDSGKSIQGNIIGVDDDGQLLILPPDGECRAFSSGEISSFRYAP